MTYAEQLAHWSLALAQGRSTELRPALAGGSTAADVDRYVANALGERYRLILEETSLVGLAFEQFERLVADYIREVPRQTFDVDASDCERFLKWLAGTRDLSEQQRDFIAYQLAEYAVLSIARCRRAEHLAFQRLRRRHAADAAQPFARACLNPIRTLARLSAPAMTRGAGGCCDFVFFAVNDQIKAMPLDAGDARLFDSLSRAPFARVEDLVRSAPQGAASLVIERLRTWTELGLAAVMVERFIVGAGNKSAETAHKKEM